jgi:hypothetical protein
LEDRRRTIDDLVDLSGVSWGSCQRILSEDLQMKRVATKFVPRASAQSLECQKFLTKNGITQLLHSPYSPDLAPYDFFLFPRINKVLKQKRFADVEEVKEKTTGAIKGITLEEFQDCFETWKTRLDRCIASNGQYFEGD